MPLDDSNRTKWIKLNGTEHRKEAGVICGMKDDLPIVGEVLSIFVVDYKKVF